MKMRKARSNREFDKTVTSGLRPPIIHANETMEHVRKSSWRFQNKRVSKTLL